MDEYQDKQPDAADDAAQDAAQGAGEDSHAADYTEAIAAIAEVLAQVLASIDALRGELSQAVQVSNAAAVESGASVTDAGDAEPEIIDEVVDPAERDYSLD